MEKKTKVIPLDDDIEILLDINADEFHYLLKNSGTRPNMLASTQAAIDLKLTKHAIVGRMYGYWTKNIEPITAAVLLQYIGYPLMRILRDRYKLEKLKKVSTTE